MLECPECGRVAAVAVSASGDHRNHECQSCGFQFRAFTVAHDTTEQKTTWNALLAGDI